MNTKPSAILLTCEYKPFPGGIATVAFELARTFATAGASVHVLAPHYDEAPSVAEGVQVSRIFGHHKIGVSAAIKAALVVARAPRSSRILALDIRTAMLAFLICLVTFRRFDVFIHGSEVSKFASNGLMKSIVRSCYLSAERVVANSKATLDLFKESFGAPRKSEIAHLGVDPTWFTSPAASFANPDLQAIPAGTLVACTVGRIEDRKGQAEALRAVKAASEAVGRKIVYVIAGQVIDQPYADEIANLSRELSQDVLLTGRLSQDDIVRLYNVSICHLLCAQKMQGKIEGFGLVLLEAAAQGCPSICTRVGGIPEVVEADTGFVFEPGDIAGMSGALASLASDPQVRKRYGDAARSRALEFTWLNCAHKTIPEIFQDRP